MRDVQFQIQSIQGALAPRNPFKYAFAMSDGSLATAEYVAGDYTNSNITVSLAKTVASAEGEIDGKVKVNNTEYTKPVETTPNAIVTLEAVDGTQYVFDHWSTGSKVKKIQVIATDKAIQAQEKGAAAVAQHGIGNNAQAAPHLLADEKIAGNDCCCRQGHHRCCP